MIYEFDDIVKEQIDFYYKNQNHVCDFTEYDVDSYTNHNKKDRIFRYANEIILDESVKSNIESYVKKLREGGEKAYISTSTISNNLYELHPFVNIHTHWYGTHQRKDITWDCSNEVPLFDSKFYDYKKELTFNKQIKSIISVRKNTEFRDYLFSKIEKDDNSIFRYVSYQNDARNETDEDRSISIKYPEWNELLSEYDNSIISFVVESEKNLHKKTSYCQISEKTLLSFLSGNIVVLLGGYLNIKQLNDLGLYTFNEYFGFDTDDNYNYYERIDSFIAVYNKIKSLSFEDCKKIWLDNKDKIQKNYDIVSNLVIKKWN